MDLVAASLMAEGPTTDEQRDNAGDGMIVGATAYGALAVLAFQATASRDLGTDGFAPIAVLWTVMFLLPTVLMLPAEQHLTRALVVTRSQRQLAKIRRETIAAFVVALVIGVLFTIATLDRFFQGNGIYIAITAGIVISRSIMATARGTLAGNRRFAGYGGSIALEASALLLGGVLVAIAGWPAPAFGVVMALAPLATLLGRPFRHDHVEIDQVVDAQPGEFLAWLIMATAASQIIIAGGPIAVSFVGGSAAAVSIFFTSFALLRGPITSAYNLVARVLPDFTALAHGEDPRRLWDWAPRIALAGVLAAVVGAAGSGIVLIPLVTVVYGSDFAPPLMAAILGGAGVGFGLGALFATQVYSAAADGKRLVLGWFAALVASAAILVLVDIEPISRVALAFAVGEGTGLVMLGAVLARHRKVRPKVTDEPGT
jgi:O-antigen/teichoic acid export membrane protein